MPRWHVSPRPAPPTGDDVTGEIRIPLEIYSVDQPQGDADLVLSRTESERLHATLSRLLNRSGLVRTARPSAIG